MSEQLEPQALTPEERLLHVVCGRVPRTKSADELPLTPEERAKREARLRGKIDAVLATLTDRERQIIKMRYGLGDEKTYTLDQVGRNLGVTPERVRQVEAKAVRKLMEPVVDLGQAPDTDVKELFTKKPESDPTEQ